MKGLTSGRMVHYVESDGYYSPAIIEHVWDKDGLVNLFVMHHDEQLRNHRSETTVRYSDKNEPYTWHWIEKA